MLTSTRKVKRIELLAHILFVSGDGVFIKDRDPGGASTVVSRKGRTRETENKTSFRSSYRMVNILIYKFFCFLCYIYVYRYMFYVKAASILNFSCVINIKTKQKTKAQNVDSARGAT